MTRAKDCKKRLRARRFLTPPSLGRARAVMPPTGPSTSGKLVVSVLVGSAACAALASSIYPVLIAPEKQSGEEARAQTTGLKRAGMWDTVARKAKS